MVALATALVLLAAQFACPDSTTASATPHFAIAYQRDGGLAPSLRSLRVRPGRRAIVRASGTGDQSGRLLTARFRIGTAQVKRLRRALARAHFRTIETPAPGSSACADCYLYRIRYRGHSVALDDTQVPGGLRPVIGRIEALIAAHLPFH